jgi:hypothetical protein
MNLALTARRMQPFWRRPFIEGYVASTGLRNEPRRKTTTVRPPLQNCIAC